MADTDTFVYKNAGKQALTFINIGIVQPGDTVKSETELNHPDMKLSTITKSNGDEGQSSTAVGDKEDNAGESKK